MTALDCFSLSEQQWEEVEGRYEEAAGTVDRADSDIDQASQLLAALLPGLSIPEQKALALGIMVGRASR